MQRQPYTTIFASQPQKQQPNAEHPLFYYQNRNQFLTSLSDKYASKYTLPTLDLKRNVRVNYYLQKYQNIQKKIQKQKVKQNCFLQNQEFSTVFSECILDRREKKREQKEMEQLKRDLNKFLMYEQEIHEKPEHDKEEQEQQEYRTVLVDYREDQNKKRQMYLLDLQIGKLMLQQKLNKATEYKQENCQNQQLISKLSNNILSAYMLNFDEIYNQLIDQILTEEVYYLNYMQANYQVEKRQWKTTCEDEPRQVYGNTKAIQMMELVKGLEDLCDD